MENELERLAELLKTMNVPENRQDDLVWLYHNLETENRDNPNFTEAIKIVRAQFIYELL